MIYLDNAATTMPKPTSVIRAVTAFAERCGANPGRSGHRLSIEAAQQVFNCRSFAAELFGASPENVVFTLNCTHALNIVIKGVLKKGDHVIISDMEHNSVYRPIYKLAEAGEITFSSARVFEGEPEKTLKAFAMLITPRTRLVVCTAGSNLCGIITPVKELYSLCKSKKILFAVDMAQAAGVLDYTIDDADFLCMPGHKGLYGPTGTGLLITKRGEELKTLMEGGSGSGSYLPVQPEFMPDRHESGTLNTYGIAGLAEGIKFVSAVTPKRIYEHELELTGELYYRLSKIRGVTLYTKPPEQGVHLPVLCFNIADMQSEDAVAMLSERGYALRGGFHCTPMTHKKLKTEKRGAVRASVSVYNTSEHITGLADEVKNIADGAAKG